MPTSNTITDIVANLRINVDDSDVRTTSDDISQRLQSAKQTFDSYSQMA